MKAFQSFTSNIPLFYAHIIRLLRELHRNYPSIDVNVITERLNDMVPDIVDYGTNIVSNVVPMIFSVSVSIVTFSY